MPEVAKSYSKSTNPIIDYCSKLTVTQHPLQLELQEATLASNFEYRMLGAPEVLSIGQAFLKLVGGKKALDIGTFTGASALAWALALPDDGKVISFDVDHSALNLIGKPILSKCPTTFAKIDFKLGSAVEGLDKLITEGHSGEFDLAFIDADKVNYSNYYDKAVELLRPGGVILVDNALWGGRVASHEKDVSTNAIDAANRRINEDPRTASFLVNTGDGLHVAFKL